MRTIERLFMRLVLLFLAIHRTPCNAAACRCKGHEVLIVTRFGWYTWWAFMLAMFIYSCVWVGHR